MQALPRPLRWPPIFPLQKGLVGWWPFDERSGAKALDRSGKRNHGTLEGPTWVAGRRGSALSFDRVTNYVEVADDDSLDVQKCTIMCWVKCRIIPGSMVLVSKYGAAGQRSFLLYYHSEREQFSVIVSLDGTALIEAFNPASVTIGVWYHVVSVHDGVELSLYVDAVQGTPVAAVGNIFVSTTNLRLGDAVDFHFLLGGIIQKVHIYNRPLNAAEIKRLYESELRIVRH